MQRLGWSLFLCLNRSLENEQRLRRLGEVEAAQCRLQLQTVRDENTRLRKDIEVGVLYGGLSALLKAFFLVIVVYLSGFLDDHYHFLRVVSLRKSDIYDMILLFVVTLCLSYMFSCLDMQGDFFNM